MRRGVPEGGEAIQGNCAHPPLMCPTIGEAEGGGRHRPDFLPQQNTPGHRSNSSRTASNRPSIMHGISSQKIT